VLKNQFKEIMFGIKIDRFVLKNQMTIFVEVLQSRTCLVSLLLNISFPEASVFILGADQKHKVAKKVRWKSSGFCICGVFDQEGSPKRL